MAPNLDNWVNTPSTDPNTASEQSVKLLDLEGLTDALLPSLYAPPCSWESLHCDLIMEEAFNTYEMTLDPRVFRPFLSTESSVRTPQWHQRRPT